MIASYSHSRYEFSGVTDTDTFAADFLFTRRPLKHEDEEVIPQNYKKRYLERIRSVAPLTQFEILAPSMTGSAQESFNQPRIKISGSLVIDSPHALLDRIPAAAIRAFGVPVTPGSLEKEMAESLLRKCGKIILWEFESFMLPRSTDEK